MGEELDKLNAHVDEFNKEAGQIVDGILIPSSDLKEWYLRSQNLLDRLANIVCQVVVTSYRKVQKKEKPLCGNCNYQFWPKKPPSGFLILLPGGKEDFTKALGMGICPNCIKIPEGELIVQCAGRIWPTVREMDAANIMPEGGNA